MHECDNSLKRKGQYHPFYTRLKIHCHLKTIAWLSTIKHTKGVKWKIGQHGHDTHDTCNWWHRMACKAQDDQSKLDWEAILRAVAIHNSTIPAVLDWIGQESKLVDKKNFDLIRNARNGMHSRNQTKRWGQWGPKPLIIIIINKNEEWSSIDMYYAGIQTHPRSYWYIHWRP